MMAVRTRERRIIDEMCMDDDKMCEIATLLRNIFTTEELENMGLNCFRFLSTEAGDILLSFLAYRLGWVKIDIISVTNLLSIEGNAIPMLLKQVTE